MLDNFDIHLKNRAHRADVQMRVNAAVSAAADGASLPAGDIIGGQAIMGEPGQWMERTRMLRKVDLWTIDTT
ncbi:hypothetical protein OC846_003099 [Tilletia horrida]|uniref:Uncharacterized protein n=1 Tax=Tilletia horrida TaxID=155126 RepID=A0AAN6GVI0_9BASI|nr:hypothetical protein OC846_003099 [Tilletia horrida]